MVCMCISVLYVTLNKMHSSLYISLWQIRISKENDNKTIIDYQITFSMFSEELLAREIYYPENVAQNDK